MGTGLSILLTGLPSSGKSTLARAAAELIPGRTELLDGDEVRRLYFPELGFDRASRFENVQRTARIAILLAHHGVVVLVPMIAPYRDARQRARQLHIDADLPFLEVWVNTPLHECVRRDVKGLYRDARRGAATAVTGLDDPYEEPPSPELTIDTRNRAISECAAAIAACAIGRLAISGR
ncbi:MAG: adenylyl-sulfate kinase [Pseudonocardia sp.]